MNYVEESHAPARATHQKDLNKFFTIKQKKN